MSECQSHDRTKGPQDQEEISKDISALLAEYSAIKAEEAACEQTQITLATSLFSFIAAIFGLNCFFAKSVDTNAVQFMILGLCPPMIMFFGVLWIEGVSFAIYNLQELLISSITYDKDRMDQFVLQKGSIEKVK